MYVDKCKKGETYIMALSAVNNNCNRAPGGNFSLITIISRLYSTCFAGKNKNLKP